ncbi:MAG: hypothetical protein R2939_16900 [Kofleriaceae bacterium]
MRRLHAWAATVSTTALAAAGCGGSSPAADAGPPPAWRRDLPPASAMGVRRGLTPARGLVHLHSPYSHDACDGDPRPGGAPDETCLADLRLALCTTHQDFAALTDHDDSMADEDFATLFSMRADDAAVIGPGGGPIASRITCADGHQVLITVGGENPLMPIMLDRHVDGDVATRHDTYNARDAAAITAMREAGAKIWIPHTEQWTAADVRAVLPDGLEAYNLHANLDPDIRAEFLGLPASGAIAAVASFADTNPDGPEPDLALISFLEASQPALDLWDALLGDGVRLAGTAGSDAHQNALPIMLRDGERGDSYRRVMRWFANVVLVDDPSDPTAIEAALAGGRLFAAFEVLGTPVGFDVVARTAGGASYELGDVAPIGATLEVTVPTVWELDPGLPTPQIRAIVYRVDGDGREVVADGAGPTLTVALDLPGAYRVEVRMTARHLAPYLGNVGTAPAERELPWIYASPLYVGPQ